MDQDSLTTDEFLDLLRTDAQRPAIIAQDSPFGPLPGQVFGHPDTLRTHELVLPHMAEWAGMNVVLITENDLPTGLLRAAETLQTDYKDWTQSLSYPLNDAQYNVRQTFERDSKRLGRTGDRAWSAAFERLTGHAPAAADAEGQFAATFAHEAYASRIEDENGTPYCVIRTFESDWTPQDFFTTLAHLDDHAHLAAPVPGDMANWLGLVAAHEAAHCAQGTDNDIRSNRPDWQPTSVGTSPRTVWAEGRLAREIEADRAALQHFNARAAEDPRVERTALDAFIAGRALSSLLLHGQREKVSPMAHDHATNPALPHNTHPPVWTGNTHDFAAMQALLAALDEASTASTLLIAHAYPPAAGQAVRFPITACGDITIAFTRCVTIAFETTAEAVRTQSYDRMRYGHSRAAENPALRHGALLALHETGYFAADPVQNAYVEQFLTAAEQYAPGLLSAPAIGHFRALLAATPALADEIRAETPFAASAHKYSCLNGRAAPDAPCR